MPVAVWFVIPHRKVEAYFTNAWKQVNKPLTSCVIWQLKGLFTIRTDRNIIWRRKCI